MPVPHAATSQAPYLRIADDLRAKISKGVYPPGAQLPAIKTLAREYRRAPDTISRALRLLGAEGLVRTDGTTGTFVREEPGEPSREFVMEARGMQEVLRRLDKIEERLADVEKGSRS
jgi:DNA-binding GntR family transcriptional regulator